MIRCARWAFLLMIGLCFWQDPAAADAGERGTSRFAWIGEDGKLVYHEDENGNRIPDFSNCGYGGGGVALPQVPVRVTLEPADGDDGASIQAAIDRLAKMPTDRNGIRGAILLKRGRYNIAGSIQILHSGIVLRGEGQGEDGTVLVGTGTKQRPLIRIGPEVNLREVSNSRRSTTGDYIPVGARQIPLEHAKGLKVGDTIIVFRPSTAEWISTLGMDKIPPRRDGLPVAQWEADSRNLQFDRVITAIKGNTITIDAPIANALEQRFGGGAVFRYEFPQRITQVGVENLRGVSEYDKSNPEDEQHAWTFIKIEAAENAWVRDITAQHFGFAAVELGRRAKWVTVQDCSYIDPVSRIQGSRRYPFSVNGQLCLVQRCSARDARHDYATGSIVPGPNVFLDSTGEGSHADSGPHHRWAVGMLYDNIRVSGHQLIVQDRLNMGSGHGWAGANHVFWNSTADGIVCQMPPTAQNWAIGCVGKLLPGAFERPQGHIDSHNRPVAPRSLYLQQLQDRLGEQAVRNVATKEQLQGD